MHSFHATNIQTILHFVTLVSHIKAVFEMTRGLIITSAVIICDG